MPFVVTKSKIVAEHFKADIGAEQQWPFFSSRQVIGFDEYFKQIAQVVLNPVAQREFLAARQSIQNRQRVFEQIISFGGNNFFGMFHENVSWLGHIRFGQHDRLEYRVFWRLNHQKLNVVVHPRNSWRVF